MISKIILTVLMFICPITSYAGEQGTRAVPQGQKQVQLSFAPIVKKVAPAVVNIYTKRTVATRFSSPFMNDPFFGHFFNNGAFGNVIRKHVENSLGSGVIASEGGLVVTNAHVVRGADEISVVLADGNEFNAKLVLSDKASDLALLQIDGDKGAKFPFVEFKPSETLEVGDLVLAIGNPFGVGQTVTSGIVSAQGRSSLDINDYNFFIQTDAAINPGNSGGALVSMDGRVVGINTAIYSRSGGSMGIGFSIPAEMVVSVIAAVENGQIGDKGIKRPWLGVSAQDITPDIAQSLNMDKPEGALISYLHSASPLKEAGVKIGDVVLLVDGYRIKDAAEMKFRMATIPVGNQASIRLLRADKEIDLKVNAIFPPEIPPRDEIELKGKHALRGAVIANLNPAVSVELGFIKDEQGVVVLSVPRRSYASRVVGVGDILLKVNDMEIKQTADVEKALSIGASKGVSMVVKRAGRVSRIYIR